MIKPCMVHLGEKMVNDYERLRQENIQRNNAILSALELNSATSSTQADCSREFKKSSLERCELDFCFDVGPSYTKSVYSRTGSLPTRSSSRISSARKTIDEQAPGVSAEKFEEVHDPKRKKLVSGRPSSMTDESALDDSSMTLKRAELKSVQNRKVVSSDSSRNLRADLSLLERVLGDSVPGGHVKAGVMQYVSPNHEPKFSKYTGIFRRLRDQTVPHAEFLSDQQEYRNGRTQYFS